MDQKARKQDFEGNNSGEDPRWAGPAGSPWYADSALQAHQPVKWSEKKTNLIHKINNAISPSLGTVMSKSRNLS